MDWFEESGASTQAGWESVLPRHRQAAVTDLLFRTPQSPTFSGKRIFVVHGHDVGARAAVAQYLTKLA